MPKPLRPTFLALILAAVLAVAGCGGSSGPDPSIGKDSAATLLGQLQEIKDNVDVGSPCVAADRTDNLIADVQALPSSVNPDVREALSSGSNNLKILLSGECESHETTTQETTTTPEETTTERTESTTKTTPTQTETTPTQTQTQTTPTQPQTTPGDSGGIGPGGL